MNDCSLSCKRALTKSGLKAFPFFKKKELDMRLIGFFVLLLSFSLIHAEEGYLVKSKGQRVLHLKGTPREMGLQHGKLLKDLIQQNVSAFLEGPRSALLSKRGIHFKEQLPNLIKHIPQNLWEEMEGVAEGAEIAFEKILLLNLFPEMFHCSAIVAYGNATHERELYHVRVLDYKIGKGLSNSAVLMIVEPNDGHPFMNVGYAGFIGSVTGMNAQKIAIGEIGGQGYGSWDGIPMAFLIRMILEKASTLEEAKEMLTKAPRTCEYFYILSDGKDNSSVGIYATAQEIKFIKPGTYFSHIEVDKDNFTTTQMLRRFPHQTVLYNSDGSLATLSQTQPENCLLLTGLTSPERYPVLAERLLKNFGSIDEKVLQLIIQDEGGKLSNLHNAIFLPAKLKLWVAHATPDGQPAYAQPYTEFSLPALLSNGSPP